MNEHGFAASIVEGEHSQYDVLSDGELVFSKQQRGRFPDRDEIIAALQTT